MRKSPATERNPDLGDRSDWAENNVVDNMGFFERAFELMTDKYKVGNGGQMAIGFVGSRDIPGVTLRRAQSMLRWDRRPSLWSHAFLIAQPWRSVDRLEDLPIWEIPLLHRGGRFPSPDRNGLFQNSTLGLYSNPRIDANVALVTASMPTEGDDMNNQDLDDDKWDKIRSRADDPNFDRVRFDFWEDLSVWNQYLWSDGRGENPLRQGVPIPASLYIEMAYEEIRMDLLPGASERTSAPEHLWGAVRWWHQRRVKGIEQSERPYVLQGCYVLRDPGCSQLSSDLEDSDLIDINYASTEELSTLPGIGYTRARDIVSYRQEHGPFSRFDELDAVPGIGKVILKDLRDEEGKLFFVEPVRLGR